MDRSATGKQIRVGVRELRGSLTRYLREARQGASILVTSRDDVIAAAPWSVVPVTPVMPAPKADEDAGRRLDVA